MLSKSGGAWHVTLLVVAVLAYFVYLPLPNDIADRYVLQIFETAVRLFYMYPMCILKALGAEWQVFWARLALHSLIAILNPLTFADPNMKINDMLIANVPVRVYEPLNRTSDGVFLYIHGGGFVLLTTNSYDGPIRQIVRNSGVLTVAIEYRLAPEHKFPAGLEDCLAVTEYFLKYGRSAFNIDPSKIVIGGDSAGGNLATVVSQKLRHDNDLPDLRAQVLLYPFLQYIDLMTPSYQHYHAEYSGAGLLDPHSIARWMLLYLGLDSDHAKHVLANEHVSPEVHAAALSLISHEDLPVTFKKDFYQPPFDGRNRSYVGSSSEALAKLQQYLLNPDFSPLMQTDLSNLPEAFLITCEYDILRDEGFWYANRLRNAGVPVLHRHYEQGFHAMITFHRDIQVGQQALLDVASYLRQIL